MSYKAVLYNDEDKAMIVINELNHFTKKDNGDGSFDYKFTPSNGDPYIIGGCFLNLAIFDDEVQIEESDIVTDYLPKKYDETPFIFVDDPKKIIETQQKYIIALEEKSLLLQNELNKLRGLA
ncbi:hypothetical protein KYI11_10720 [Macrococcoides bohemicum]|uniref:Uncharacterized protein n=1 Tax=Macrococcoides bohemicum TaxID=1903056 RepID=A0AAJ4TWZ4_9STAP|nr:hypothetical protein [Macrococcus bohemicus]QYA42057.1 hypothetical protein KYI11_10720 [Macrococcus bohemicus]